MCRDGVERDVVLTQAPLSDEKLLLGGVFLWFGKKGDWIFK